MIARLGCLEAVAGVESCWGWAPALVSSVGAFGGANGFGFRQDLTPYSETTGGGGA